MGCINCKETITCSDKPSEVTSIINNNPTNNLENTKIKENQSKYEKKNINSINKDLTNNGKKNQNAEYNILFEEKNEVIDNLHSQSLKLIDDEHQNYEGINKSHQKNDDDINNIPRDNEDNNNFPLDNDDINNIPRDNEDNNNIPLDNGDIYNIPPYKENNINLLNYQEINNNHLNNKEEHNLHQKVEPTINTSSIINLNNQIKQNNESIFIENPNYYGQINNISYKNEGQIDKFESSQIEVTNTDFGTKNNSVIKMETDSITDDKNLIFNEPANLDSLKNEEENKINSIIEQQPYQEDDIRKENKNDGQYFQEPGNQYNITNQIQQKNINQTSIPISLVENLNNIAEQKTSLEQFPSIRKEFEEKKEDNTQIKKGEINKYIDDKPNDEILKLIAQSEGKFSNLLDYEKENNIDTNNIENEIDSKDNKNPEINSIEKISKIENFPNLNLLNFNQHYEPTKENSLNNNNIDNKDPEIFDSKEFNNLHQISADTAGLNLEHLISSPNNDIIDHQEKKEDIFEPLNIDNLEQNITTIAPLITDNLELNKSLNNLELTQNQEVNLNKDTKDIFESFGINELRQVPTFTENETPETHLNNLNELSTSQLNSLINKNTPTKNEIPNISLKRTTTLNERSEVNTAEPDMKEAKEASDNISTNEINNFYQKRTTTKNEFDNYIINDLPININTSTENMIKENIENSKIQITSSIDINDLNQITTTTSINNSEKSISSNNLIVNNPPSISLNSKTVIKEVSPNRVRILNLDDLKRKYGYKSINFYYAKIKTV